MKKLLSTASLILILSGMLSAQITVSLTVNSGASTTTCTDVFGAPDPFWSVAINGSAWVTYPQSGGCFTALPNLQYTQTFSCLNDIPPSLEVCFRAFENDGLFGCDIIASCEEIVCQNYALDFVGSQNYSLELGNGLSSGGSVQFTITIDGTPDNVPYDLMCNAVDLGILDLGVTLGDAASSDYSNFCATNTGEPNPSSQGAGWSNNVGVWLTFTTGPNPLPYTYLQAVSDPSGLGDPVNLQVAIYESSDGTCTGTMTLFDQSYDTSSWDEEMSPNCLTPNTTYFILIDGVTDSQQETYGYFGLEILAYDIIEGADERCDAEDFGMIPDGGSVTTAGVRSNRCATSVGDPFIPAFVPQQSVWFRFIPPLSGHVIIEANNASPIPAGEDEIGLQIALIRSINNLCTGFFFEVESVYTAGDFDEVLEVSCLNPTRPYWILIDGDGNNTDGVFTLTITDAGDDTPILNQDITLCDGESIMVGGSTYTQSGVYADTILIGGGCDSIVNTTLTVLDPIYVDLTIDSPASGSGIADGVATVGALSGGVPPFSYLWSPNVGSQTTATATGLPGNGTACVTIFDSNGCEGDTCFTVPFLVDIIPTVTNGSLLCNGDTDGTISLSAINGQPPYTFTWTNLDSGDSGTGNIPAAGDVVDIKNLTGGDYSITLTDGLSDTIVLANVFEPLPLQIDLLPTDASCAGTCDGQVQANVQGGTGGYTYTWDNAGSGDLLSGLCADAYTVTVEDANGCQEVMTTTVAEPPEFVATATVTANVSCFGGSDGSITVTTNGNPIAYQWSTAANTPSISGLPGGNYSVTVTNDDGCQAIAFATVQTPSAPVTVSIQLIEPVSCSGEADGVLQAVAGGPGTGFSYSWSNSAATSQANNLSTGNYTVTVVSNAGCTATASFFLDEPEPMVVEWSSKDITCLPGEEEGLIQVDTVSGGVGPYLYALNNGVFSSDPQFGSLTEGPYQLKVMDAAGCEQVIPVTITAPPELFVDLGPDQMLALGEPLLLDASTNAVNALFTWAADGIPVLCPTFDCQTLELVPVASGTYTVVVQDTITQCRASDELYVEVRNDRKIFFPNAFSPNFDGSNDYFVMYGALGVNQVLNFRVFDRNGALVYEAAGFLPGDESYGWDGTFRGQKAQTGVYAYFAEIEFIDGDRVLFKGDVLLVR